MIGPKEFRNWQSGIEVEGRAIRGNELARRLGRTPEYISRVRAAGVPDGEESIMRLAMAAIATGLKPWGAA